MKHAPVYFLIVGCSVTHLSVAMDRPLFIPTRWMLTTFEELQQTAETEIYVDGLDPEREKNCFIQVHRMYFNKLERDDLEFGRCTAQQIWHLGYERLLNRNRLLRNKSD